MRGVPLRITSSDDAFSVKLISLNKLGDLLCLRRLSAPSKVTRENIHSRTESLWDLRTTMQVVSEWQGVKISSD